MSQNANTVFMNASVKGMNLHCLRILLINSNIKCSVINHNSDKSQEYLQLSFELSRPADTLHYCLAYKIECHIKNRALQHFIEL